MFTVNEDKIRADFAEIGDPEGIGESWWIGLESPARDIEQLVADWGEAITSDREGWSIWLYPLIYESDADGLLIVIYRGGAYDQPGLAGHPSDWDDYVPGPRAAFLNAPLGADGVIGVLRCVADAANRIIEGEERT